MKYTESNQDLFIVPDDYYFAHCISADFKLGAGIAVEFNKRFNMKNKLINNNNNYLDMFINNSYQADCIIIDNVFNLITKERYWHKPTYITITIALTKMKEIALQNNIKKIAMPIIGCGLDRLQWNKVSEIIKEIFNDTDIEILICIK